MWIENGEDLTWKMFQQCDKVYTQLGRWILRKRKNQSNLWWTRGGGGQLGIFWVGMCRPELQIGTPF